VVAVVFGGRRSLPLIQIDAPNLRDKEDYRVAFHRFFGETKDAAVRVTSA